MMIKVNMLSQADKVAGQGVGSAYLEQVALCKTSSLLDITINSRRSADILHVHTINLRYYFRMNTKKSVKVVYVHFLPETLEGSIKLPKPIFALLKKYVIRFYKKADVLVVVNPIFANDLKRHGIQAEKIKYIPNLVDDQTFFEMPIEKRLEKRKELNLTKDDFVVMGVGQVQTRKGVLDFVNVAKRCPKVKFIWCGGFSFGKITDGYEALKEVMKNPPANVQFLGIIPRGDMNTMYNVSDCLFMPSYNELFPMAILEAASVGRPLILRDLELYEDILFGWYLRGKDNDAFAKIIQSLKTKDVYQDKQTQALKIKHFYSKSHVLTLWEEFYQSLVNKKA